MVQMAGYAIIIALGVILIFLPVFIKDKGRHD